MKKAAPKKRRNRLFVVLAQACVKSDVEFNLHHTAQLIRAAARQGAQIVCLQELFSEANHALLSLSKDQDGNSLEVIKLPMPDAVVGPEARFPASYVNFYIGNEVVVVPVFGQKKDGQALELIQNCFKTRRVVGVDSTTMVHRSMGPWPGRDPLRHATRAGCESLAGSCCTQLAIDAQVISTV
jgi:hypothetical protein